MYKCLIFTCVGSYRSQFTKDQCAQCAFGSIRSVSLQFFEIKLPCLLACILPNKVPQANLSLNYCNE